jgi:hypothetical protein
VDEVTLKDIINGTGEKKKGYRKLQFCGTQAENDDLHYFWVDTCCIDKSNERELTTSINSMFKWYQNAARCYVYLSDVEVRAQDGQVWLIGKDQVREGGGMANRLTAYFDSVVVGKVA